MTNRHPLAYYLQLAYPFRVAVEPEGGWSIVFPDLPGCVSVAETWEEIGTMASDACKEWITAAYEQGLAIPEPSRERTYSGVFNLRLPKSLHRQLAEAAEEEGVSLNQLAATLIAAGLGAMNGARRSGAADDPQDKTSELDARRLPVHAR